MSAGMYQPSTTCGGYLNDVRVAPIDLVADLGRLELLTTPASEKFDTAAAVRLVSNLIAEAESMPTAEDVECGFDGEVDDVHYARMSEMVTWSCPRCGEDREEDAPGPDPDDARDAMLDAQEDWR